MQESLKLSEFLGLIKSTIEVSFGYDGFWVVAELSEWRKYGIHYYGELIEHDGISKYPVAKIRCNCWSTKANTILSKFKTVSGENLRSDMKVLLKVSINYNASFGLSLNILDIDPSFTLGDRQAKKLEILQELTRKKIMNNNKNKSLPKDFVSVAVITSPTAAGKGDFFEEADKLQSLDLCKFVIYKAKMQGKDCVSSVSTAFTEIFSKIDKYDAIVVIRGGGSQSDLDWFNNIVLAEHICNSDLPVFVGIGHERDSTVLDDVCTRSFDTPSKVIGFITNAIIENANCAAQNYRYIVNFIANTSKQYDMQLESLYTSLKTQLNNHLHSVEMKIEHDYKNTISISKSIIKLYEQSLDMQFNNLNSYSTHIVKKFDDSLEYYNEEIVSIINKNIIHTSISTDSIYRQILAISIEPTLNRGFSVTKSKNGKYISSKKQAVKCKELEIMYSDGNIKVEVQDGNTK